MAWDVQMSETMKRTANKASKLHPVQIAYFTARAAYEVAQSAYEADCKATGNVLTRGMSEADVDRICEAQEEIRARHSLDVLGTVKIEAEHTLIKWSVDVAIAMAPHRRADLEYVRDNAKYHLKIWAQLVDNAARLVA